MFQCSVRRVRVLWLLASRNASFGEILGGEMRVVAQDAEPGAKAPFYFGPLIQRPEGLCFLRVRASHEYPKAARCVLSSGGWLAILCECAGENILLRMCDLALWCNWLTRRPLKAESPGSSPGNATKIFSSSVSLKQTAY